MPEVKEKPAAAAEKTDARTLVYSVFPFQHVVLRADRSTWREAEGGKMVSVPVSPREHIEFNHHKYMATQDELAVLKTKPWYGFDMISAPDLKKMLSNDKTKTTARGIIKKLERHGALAKANKLTYEDIIDELAEL